MVQTTSVGVRCKCLLECEAVPVLIRIYVLLKVAISEVCQLYAEVFNFLASVGRLAPSRYINHGHDVL